MAAVVGFYAYGEAIDLWVFLGGGIIILSNLQAFLAERRGRITGAAEVEPLVRPDPPR
ncbi:MAG: hypothetical protein ACK41Y_07015 [Paracoccus hibiscisoli]|uniref:hypothetical protein n=1 Tax=Paracoccus hibiscisoli TaxID=2023261 RepID=UPI00391CA736